MHTLSVFLFIWYKEQINCIHAQYCVEVPSKTLSALKTCQLKAKLTKVMYMLLKYQHQEY